MTDAIQSRLPGRKHQRLGLMPGIVRKIRERIRIWRATRRLLAFDDAMLKDIGIARGDIDWTVRHGRTLRHRE